LRVLEILAKACALCAGALVALMVIISCGSIIGRETVGRTLTGDFELVGLATGAAVGLFMPLCQFHRGNIVVDVFTTRAPKAFNEVLERIGAFLLALCCALLSWRAALGGWSSFQSGSTTMLLAVPEWYAYAPMVPGFALTAVIAFAQAAFGFNTPSHHGAEPA
jgi:TRAP-type C4-dicarboxylate transport system permease small subunit